MAGAAFLRAALIIGLCVGLIAAPTLTFPSVAASSAGALAYIQEQQHDTADCCECCGAGDETYRIADCLALCVAAYAVPVAPNKIVISQGHLQVRITGDRRTQRYTTPDPDPPNLSLGL